MLEIFKTKLIIIHICIKFFFKSAFKTKFLVHNNHLNLYWQVNNSKWILCNRKTDVKCGYIRFIMYKLFSLNLQIRYPIPLVCISYYKHIQQGFGSVTF